MMVRVEDKCNVRLFLFSFFFLPDTSKGSTERTKEISLKVLEGQVLKCI